MKKYLPFILAFLFISDLHAQYTIVGGTTGQIFNFDSSQITYEVECTGGANFSRFINSFSLCGILYPSIVSAYTGSANAPYTIKYTFSEPMTMLKLAVGGTGSVGPPGSITLESFLFSTNGGVPSLSINSGTCAPWIINANEIISPSVPGALNAIIDLSSETPFTEVTIMPGSVNDIGNLGSGFGLCANGLLSTENIDSVLDVHVYPNPSDGIFTIDNNLGYQLHYSVYNLLGEILFEGTTTNQRLTVNLQDFPATIYFLKIFYGNSSRVKKLIRG